MIATIDFRIWDELLQRYVDDLGRVNYRRWKAEGADVLRVWLESLADVDLADFTDADARLALWLNAYNAIAISQVLEVYPIASIRPKVLGIPNWLSFLDFFTRSNTIIGGKKYSLNQIEHAILLAGICGTAHPFCISLCFCRVPAAAPGGLFPGVGTDSTRSGCQPFYSQS